MAKRAKILTAVVTLALIGLVITLGYILFFDYITVNFYSGTNLESSVKVKRGAKIDKESIPEVEVGEYFFEYWYEETSPEKAFDFEKPITKNIDLHAYFKLKIYLTVHLNDSSDDYYMVMGKAGTLAELYHKAIEDSPNNLYYDFLGFSQNADGSGLITFSEGEYSEDILFSENTEYYVIWEPKSLFVTFSLKNVTTPNSGDAEAQMQNITIHYGEYYTIDLSEFDMLYEKGTGAKIAGLKLKGDEQLYRTGDKILIVPEIIENGSLILEPVFEEDEAGNSIENSVKIFFENGDENESFYGVGTELEFPSPEREFFELLGYYTDLVSYKGLTEEQLISVGSNLLVGQGVQAYYAIWRPCEITVLFNQNTTDEIEGNNPEQTVRYSETVLLQQNNFDRGEDWSFVGWALSPDGNVVYTDESNELSLEFGSPMVTDNQINLYAIWKKRTVMVAFDYNNGTGSVFSLKYVIGATVKLPSMSETNAERLYYTFKGWSENQYDSIDDIPDTENNIWLEDEDYTVNEDITNLYAVWEHNKISVTLRHNNETNAETVWQFNEGAEASLMNETDIEAEFKEFTIIAWNTEADGTGTFYGLESKNNLIPADPMTLYAVWSSPIQNFVFNPIGATEYKVKKGLAALTGEILLPCIYNGKPVTTIESSGFQSAALSSVIIPKSIVSIDQSAFNSCRSLASVKIHSAVKTIGRETFSGCTSLTVIDLDSENEYFSTINNVLFNKEQTELLCYPAGKKGSYIVPDSVKTIAIYSFSGSSELTEIDIPEGVNTIGTYAFRSCSKLNNVILPSTATTIGTGAFSFCAGLESIEIPQESIRVNANTFNGCSSLTTVKLPESLVTIDISSFNGCTLLSTINIPENVQTISDSAFQNCSSLTEITIPRKTTKLGQFVFLNCSNLTIYAEFESQPESWNSKWNSSNCPVIWLESPSL